MKHYFMFFFVNPILWKIEEYFYYRFTYPQLILEWFQQHDPGRIELIYGFLTIALISLIKRKYFVK